jgi:hypothetical protein
MSTRVSYQEFFVPRATMAIVLEENVASKRLNWCPQKASVAGSGGDSSCCGCVAGVFPVS